MAWLSVHAPVAPQPVTGGTDAWLKAMLLLLFAYGGYKAALSPMGEARNARSDVAFALFVALAILTLLYGTLQLIVVSLLADPAHSVRPLADAARVLIGEPGRGPDLRGSADVRVRLPQRQPPDFAALDVCPGGARRLSPRVRGSASALAYPLRVDRGVCAAVCGHSHSSRALRGT